MTTFLQHLDTFAHWFGTGVDCVGAAVLVSRILLLALPKPTPGATGWYPSFIAHLWVVSLDVGHLNSQL